MPRPRCNAFTVRLAIALCATLLIAASLTLAPKSAHAASAPPGYHTEKRYLAGLLIPGAIITFIGLIPLTAGLSNSADRDDDIRRAREQGPSSSERAVRQHEYDGAVVAVGLGHMAVGVPLLTFGLLFPRHVQVPNRVGVSFVPMISSEHAGGSLTISF